MIDFHVTQDTVPLAFVVPVVTGRADKAARGSVSVSSRTELILAVVHKWSHSRTNWMIQFLSMALVGNLKS